MSRWQYRGASWEWRQQGCCGERGSGGEDIRCPLSDVPCQLSASASISTGSVPVVPVVPVPVTVSKPVTEPGSDLNARETSNEQIEAEILLSIVCLKRVCQLCKYYFPIYNIYNIQDLYN